MGNGKIYTVLLGFFLGLYLSKKIKIIINLKDKFKSIFVNYVNYFNPNDKDLI